MKTLEQFFPRLKTRQIALLGLLMALILVLGRFTFGPDWLKISFTFIGGGLIAKWYGPVWGMLSAFMLDFIGNMFSPYPYFWGFALSAIAGALVYGIAFYNRPNISWVRVGITVAIVLIVVNMFMNTLWVAIIQNMLNRPEALQKLFLARALKQVLFWPVQTILLYIVLNNQSLERLKERVFN